MKSLILLTAFIGAQAYAGTIVCNRQLEDTQLEVKTVEDADKPEVVDFLRVEGLVDAEGFLDVRRDMPSMATVISKPNKIDICRGVNISQVATESAGSPQKGWRKAKLDSSALRIRLLRNHDTGEITAVASTGDTKIVFRSCQFIAEEGDQEALKAIWEETHDPEMEEQLKKDREESEKRLSEEFRRKAEQFLGISAGSPGPFFLPSTVTGDSGAQGAR